MTTLTPEDAIKAAASVARDVADGKLSPADLQAQAVAECRELFGTVVGEDDALWSLHADVARQAVSLGALSADELSEWAAVMRRRTGEASEPAESQDDPLPAVSSLSVAPSRDPGDAEGDFSDDEPEPGALQGTSIVSTLAALASAAQQAHAQPASTPMPAPQRWTDSGDYDTLAGFRPGATRRRF